jgi:hypothetical protein
MIELVKDDFIFGVEREDQVIDTHSPFFHIWFDPHPEYVKIYLLFQKLDSTQTF